MRLDTKKARPLAWENAAKTAGWEYSSAHDGWIHPEERDISLGEAGYVVMPSAEEACWLHDIHSGED